MCQVCASSSEAIWWGRRLKPWRCHRILLAMVLDHSSLLFEKLFLRWAQSRFTLTSWWWAISIPRQLWHERWASSCRSILRLRIRRCWMLGFKPNSSLCSSSKSPRRLHRLIIRQMRPRLRHRIGRLMPHRSYLIGLLALPIDITMLINISKVIILIKVIIRLLWFLLIVVILLLLLLLILVLVLSPFVLLTDVSPILHLCIFFFNCFNFQI